MTGLSFLFGAIVGLSLGLTGGGGAIFAVPLLVYGLGIAAPEAVAISLAAVGATSFVGFLVRWLNNEVEPRTGLIFAIAGMLGAPAGTWLADLIPDTLLLLMFAALMLVVAILLWRKKPQLLLPRTGCPKPESVDGPTCRRDAQGKLILNSKCTLLLLVVGCGVGVLSGLFGVGGGFVIVPALILFSGMSIHRAVGTSLMVIALVSISGIASQIVAGREISPGITGLFVFGGIAGLLTGQQIGHRLPGPLLQKLFAIAILAVAVFVIVRNVGHYVS